MQGQELCTIIFIGLAAQGSSTKSDDARRLGDPLDSCNKIKASEIISPWVERELTSWCMTKLLGEIEIVELQILLQRLSSRSRNTRQGVMTRRNREGVTKLSQSVTEVYT